MTKATAISHKHPRGLYILFFTEMWERFSFYGLRSLLVLYMTQIFLFSDNKAYGLFGAYTAMVYVTPVIGGYLADRWLGFKRAIILGGILIMLGHFTLALPLNSLFYFGLSFVICGTGLLKSCVSSIVGELYARDDPRRDSGYTIFYMGINLGAFFASILVGLVAKTVGWHYAFALAGVGMMIGLITFIWGQKYLEGTGAPPNLLKLSRKIIPGVSLSHLIYILAFIAVPIAAWFLQRPELVGGILFSVTVASVLFVISVAYKSDVVVRHRLIALVILMLFSICFFALFEQAGSSITLFTERSVDRSFMGWDIPTPIFLSLNPFFILILAPMFASLWIKLSEIGKEPSTPMKFFYGLLFVALGFGVLSYGAHFGVNDKTPMFWLITAYYLHTVGELCLSPVGLSAVTKLAPQRYVGMLMGMWFLAASFSNYLAAMIAKLTSISPDVSSASTQYATVFTQVFIVGLIVSFILLLMVPMLRRLVTS